MLGMGDMWYMVYVDMFEMVDVRYEIWGYVGYVGDGDMWNVYMWVCR